MSERQPKSEAVFRVTIVAEFPIEGTSSTERENATAEACETLSGAGGNVREPRVSVTRVSREEVAEVSGGESEEND